MCLTSACVYQLNITTLWGHGVLFTFITLCYHFVINCLIATIVIVINHAVVGEKKTIGFTPVTFCHRHALSLFTPKFNCVLMLNNTVVNLKNEVFTKEKDL